MTKTSLISVNDDIKVLVVNNYKGFARLSDIPSESPLRLDSIQDKIEDKLESKILMVRYDKILNVVEFYIIK